MPVKLIRNFNLNDCPLPLITNRTSGRAQCNRHFTHLERAAWLESGSTNHSRRQSTEVMMTNLILFNDDLLKLPTCVRYISSNKRLVCTDISIDRLKLNLQRFSDFINFVISKVQRNWQISRFFFNLSSHWSKNWTWVPSNLRKSVIYSFYILKYSRRNV
jgi:hypothetical protein